MLQFFAPHMWATFAKRSSSYGTDLRLGYRRARTDGKKSNSPWRSEECLQSNLTRFADKRGSRSRARFGDWRKILMHKFAPEPEMETPDPVSLAIFAIDRIGPAAVRACASGLEVRVAAPDEATAAVFRAALAETGRRRATDQLIRIVV